MKITKSEFNFLMNNIFSKLQTEKTSKACWAVIHEGLSAYEAEKRHGCADNSISLKVKKIRAAHKDMMAAVE